MNRCKTLLAVPALLLVAVCASAQAVSLTLKFPPGRVDSMTVTQDITQSFSSPDLPAPVKQFMKQTMDMTTKVAESGPKGAVMEVGYTRIRSSNNFTGKETSYDSEKDKDPRTRRPLA